jgi:hypothetical protein
LAAFLAIFISLLAALFTALLLAAASSFSCSLLLAAVSSASHLRKVAEMDAARERLPASPDFLEGWAEGKVMTASVMSGAAADAQLLQLEVAVVVVEGLRSSSATRKSAMQASEGEGARSRGAGAARAAASCLQVWAAGVAGMVVASGVVVMVVATAHCSSYAVMARRSSGWGSTLRSRLTKPEVPTVVARATRRAVAWAMTAVEVA